MRRERRAERVRVGRADARTGDTEPVDELDADRAADPVRVRDHRESEHRDPATGDVAAERLRDEVVRLAARLRRRAESAGLPDGRGEPAFLGGLVADDEASGARGELRLEDEVGERDRVVVPSDPVVKAARPREVGERGAESVHGRAHDERGAARVEHRGETRGRADRQDRAIEDDVAGAERIEQAVPRIVEGGLGAGFVEGDDVDDRAAPDPWPRVEGESAPDEPVLEQLAEAGLVERRDAAREQRDAFGIGVDRDDIVAVARERHRVGGAERSDSPDRDPHDSKVGT